MKPRAWLVIAGVCLAGVVLLEVFGPRKPDGTVTDWQFVIQMAGIVLGVAALAASVVTLLKRRSKP